MVVLTRISDTGFKSCYTEFAEPVINLTHQVTDDSFFNTPCAKAGVIAQTLQQSVYTKINKIVTAYGRPTQSDVFKHSSC